MRRTGLHVRRNSEAMNPEARCRAGRPCLEGSESRNRLSKLLAWPVFLLASVERSASMPSPVNRRSVDLSAFPDLVVIYLGMRVRRLAGVQTLLGLGHPIAKAES